MASGGAENQKYFHKEPKKKEEDLMKDKKTKCLWYLRLGEFHDIVADIVEQS